MRLVLLTKSSFKGKGGNTGQQLLQASSGQTQRQPTAENRYRNKLQ